MNDFSLTVEISKAERAFINIRRIPMGSGAEIFSVRHFGFIALFDYA
jgi:hypothetical protein